MTRAPIPVSVRHEHVFERLPRLVPVDIAEFFLAPIRPPGNDPAANADFKLRLIERKRFEPELGFSQRGQTKLDVLLAKARGR